MSSTPRVVVETVEVVTRSKRCRSTVTLRRGELQVAGQSEGDADPRSRWRIVAESAMDALRQLEPAATSFTIELAGVQQVGDRKLGVVTLLLENPSRDELLAGVAPVSDGAEDAEDAEDEAVVRAVLDATNRRLARLR